MDEKKKNSIMWVALVALTILSYQFSESHVGILGLILVVIASVIKFFGVSLQFLELKKAHSFWKYGLLGFLVFFYTVIYFLIS